MRKMIYFGVFEPCEDGGYSVYFPDLPGCASGGDDLEASQRNAIEALNLHIYGMEKDGDTVPAPSKVPLVDPQTQEGYIISPVTVFPDIFRINRDKRAVRTNTSIPAWLKDMAEARGINYSHVLETALMEMMDVGPAHNGEKTQ